MKRTNRFLGMIVTLLTATVLMVGCMSGDNQNSETQSADYTQAIVGARSDDDNEMEVISAQKGKKASYSSNPNGLEDSGAEKMAEMTLATLGIAPDTWEKYALSVSLMNVKAYAVGIFKPSENQTDAIKNSLQEYIANTQKSFEQYLPDQYEIAKQAKVKILSSGEVAIVMCEDASEVLSRIEKALS